MVSIKIANATTKTRFNALMKEWKKTQIAPFKITQGSYDVVNGVITDNPDITDETQYNKVFQGDNSVILRWRGSTALALTPGSEKPYTADKFRKVYKVGTLYDVYLDAITYALAGSGGSFQTNSNIKIFTKQEIPQESYFDLYVLPELNTFEYKINFVQEHRLQGTNELLYTEIELEKVNFIGTYTDTKQIFQFGSVGEGYAYPYWNGQKVQLDFGKLKNRPVKYVQVELSDPSAIASFYAFGRRIGNRTSELESFSIPEHIVPFNFVQPDGNKLTGNVSPTDLYFYGSSWQIEVDTYFTEWNSKWATYGTPDSDKTYEAHITDNDLPNTILSGGGSHTGTGINGKVSLEKTKTYWDNWIIKPGAKTFETINPYAYKTFEYNGINEYNAETLMFHNIFLFKHVQKLPMSFGEYAPKFLSTLPLIGDTSSSILTGVWGYNWFNSTSTRQQIKDVAMFVSQDLYQFNYNTAYSFTGRTQDTNPIPMDFFSEKRPDKLFGDTSFSTIWKASLTDQYKNGLTWDIQTEQYVSNQSVHKLEVAGVDYNEDRIADELIDITSLPYLNIDDFKNIFAIDRFVFQGLATTDIRITFYDESNTEISSNVYRTTGARTGSQRDWTTIIKMSDWESSIMVANGEIIFPEQEDTTPQIIIPVERLNLLTLLGEEIVPNQGEGTQNLPYINSLVNGLGDYTVENIIDLSNLIPSSVDLSLYNSIKISGKYILRQTVLATGFELNAYYDIDRRDTFYEEANFDLIQNINIDYEVLTTYNISVGGAQGIDGSGYIKIKNTYDNQANTFSIDLETKEDAFGRISTTGGLDNATVIAITELNIERITLIPKEQ